MCHWAFGEKVRSEESGIKGVACATGPSGHRLCSVWCLSMKLTWMVGPKKKKKGEEEGDGGRGRGTDGNGKKAKCDKN